LNHITEFIITRIAGDIYQYHHIPISFHGPHVFMSQVAPRYVCRGVRVMVYFRLGAAPASDDHEEADGGGETCQEVRDGALSHGIWWVNTGETLW